jgi:hypothetical protein
LRQLAASGLHTNAVVASAADSDAGDPDQNDKEAQSAHLHAETREPQNGVLLSQLSVRRTGGGCEMANSTTVIGYCSGMAPGC